MSWGVRISASPPGNCIPPAFAPRTSLHPSIASSYFKPIATGSHKYPTINCCLKPGESGSGENESRTVLDAFFLGKALAEAVNERLESTVGEFLSTIGKLQAEQQKQVKEFQDDVLERAERAKKQAAREAMEARGLVTPKSRETNISSVTNGVSSAPSSSQSNPLVERVKIDLDPTDDDPPSEASD